MTTLPSLADMRARRRATALLLALVACKALGQVAERPRVESGDRWRFVAYATVYSTAPNRDWVIESVTPTGIDGTENGQPLRLTHDLNVVESPRARDSNPGLLRFPLQVGKRWSFVNDYEFKDNGSKAHATTRVSVVGYEKVEVVAGEFDAFRIETKSNFRGRSKAGAHLIGEAVGFYWYAPAAKAIVKSIQRNQYRGTTTVELVDFSPRG